MSIPPEIPAPKTHYLPDPNHTPHPPPPPPLPRKPRSPQHVLTNAQRCEIARWMIKDSTENGQKHICARAIRRFPRYFTGTDSANFTRAIRYWVQRADIVTNYPQVGRGAAMKAAPGRGRKRAKWAVKLYKDLLEEVDKLTGDNTKMDVTLLHQHALRMVRESQCDEYGPHVKDPKSGKLCTDHVTTRWVRAFMQINRIQT